MPAKGTKIRQYSRRDLKLALEALDRRELTLNKAARRYNVPRSTLAKFHENRDRNVRIGPTPTFTAQEERQMVEWVEDLRHAGMAVKRSDLLEAAQWILETYPRQTKKIKDNSPSASWVRAFERRHPSVTACLQVEPFGEDKPAAVPERECFEEVYQHLQALDVFNEPGRLFKCNEIGFGFSFNIAQSFEKPVNGTKRADLITAAFITSAVGRLAFPMIVYPYRETIPLELAATVPLFYGCGNSATGMMTKDTFYNYVTKTFFKFLMLNRVKLPVILFVDGTRPNVSLDLWKACRKLGIILMAFNPDESRNCKKHIAYATPLTRVVKGQLDDALLRWKDANSDRFISEMNFTELLYPAVQSSVTEELILRDWQAFSFYQWILKRRTRVEEIEFVSADLESEPQQEEECVQPDLEVEPPVEEAKEPLATLAET
ncbi:hypothetical protein pipiens_006815 [Culex pipiens pipiens]|uniref:HTH CENPB-type domain-containing protein n=1 Tax=Culex pipiens pipiens TaxID=38569 RepID=A0ABD1DN49_CULPP